MEPTEAERNIKRNIATNNTNMEPVLPIPYKLNWWQSSSSPGQVKWQSWPSSGQVKWQSSPSSGQVKWQNSLSSSHVEWQSHPALVRLNDRVHQALLRQEKGWMILVSKKHKAKEKKKQEILKIKSGNNRNKAERNIKRNLATNSTNMEPVLPTTCKLN